MRNRILSVSYDPDLLFTRHKLLESQGYEIISALTFQAATERCRRGGYDLAVIGHSIPPEEKASLLKEIAQHCPVPVIALLKANEQVVEGATESVDAMHPEAFIAAVNRLAEKGRTQSLECRKMRNADANP